jgi:hypothetical protein
MLHAPVAVLELQRGLDDPFDVAIQRRVQVDRDGGVRAAPDIPRRHRAALQRLGQVA